MTASEKVNGFRGYQAAPADPASIPSWLPIPSRGTTIAILGYNSRDEEAQAHDETGDLLSDPHMDRIFDAAAKHFMVALKQDKLRITYSSESITEAVLDTGEIHTRLEANRGRERANRRRHGSGAKAWAAWECLAEGESLPCSGGFLWYQLTPGKNHMVTVFRNGMWITDDAPRLRGSSFRGIKAFTAVLNAHGDLAAAIKDCETDSHLEIKVQQAPGDSGKKTKQGLQEVQDILKKAVGELQADEWIPNVLRIFNSHDNFTKIESAPPRHRPATPDIPQTPLPWPDSEAGPAPGPEPGPEPYPRPVKPQAWRPGGVEGVRRSFVPVGRGQAVVAWDFTADVRRPANVGVAIVVGSGSQPSDRRPEPDRALLIRLIGEDGDGWVEELKAPASEGSVRVEVRDAPSDWEAVTAVVSRRA